jgi:hypothetical protein
VADGDEDAVDRQVPDGAAGGVADGDAIDRGRHLRAFDLRQLGVPDHLDLGILEQPVLQDALGAELAAAMDDGDLGGEVGEEQRLLDSGVAAADHQDLLAAVEEAVAGGAGGDAKALELLLGRQAEPARLGAGGDDDGIGGVAGAAVGGQNERPVVARGPG